jgi:hypothetical protein
MIKRAILKEGVEASSASTGHLGRLVSRLLDSACSEVAGDPVSWSSRRQSEISTSCTHIEYIGQQHDLATSNDCEPFSNSPRCGRNICHFTTGPGNSAAVALMDATVRLMPKTGAASAGRILVPLIRDTTCP